MISLEIFKLDCDDKPISTLNEGEHIFGRGALLECDDRRVSRNHGLIIVTDNAASITSVRTILVPKQLHAYLQTHQNPCFYIFASSKSITILPKDSPVNISDGDKFALLADQFWFKIRVKREHLGANDIEVAETVAEQTNNEETLKRLCEEESNNDHKKLKRDIEGGSESSHSDTNHQVSSETIDNNKSNELEEEVKNGESKQAQTSTNSDTTANTCAGKRPSRDYCLYGAQCYRKSAAHLAEFSHPGDSDYESDPNDSRPTCSYGAACYRKNKNHRKTYKHPRSMANVKKPDGTRSRKKNTKATYIDESSEDDYDMDDPFMADSGSEFEVEGDSNESESESSDDQGDEEFNRLIKEAKRFTRSRKKD